MNNILNIFRSLDSIVEEGFKTLNTLEAIENPENFSLGAPNHFFEDKPYRKLASALYHRFSSQANDTELAEDISLFLGRCGFYDFINARKNSGSPAAFMKTAYISFIVWKSLGDYISENDKNPDTRKIKLSITPNAILGNLSYDDKTEPEKNARSLNYLSLSILAEKYDKYHVFGGFLENHERDAMIKSTVSELISLYSRKHSKKEAANMRVLV